MKSLSLPVPLFVILTCGLISVADAQTVNSQDRDIGAVGAAGSASNNGSGGFTVTGSGADIWGTADEFHFVYVQLSGDMQIVARVTGVEYTDGWAKAGLMARESLDANSRNFMVFITPQLLSGIQWRDTTGGGSTYVPGGDAALPHWLKLVRAGNTLAGYRSVDGVNWTPLGSTAIALPSTLYVGMAVTSHKDGTLCTATFDNVTQSSGGGGGGGGAGTPAAPSNLTAAALSSNSIKLIWTDNATNENVITIERSTDGVNFEAIAVMSANSTTYTDTGLSAGTRYWYYVFASNAAGNSPASNVAQASTTSGSGSGWQHEDVGAVGAAGNFSQSGNTYTVSGSGFDIWGEHDEFHYAYQRGTNDVQIVARITGMANTSPWAKAGVMIRESQTACSDTCDIYEFDFAKNVLLALTPSHGLAFQWRPTQAGPTFYIDAGPASAPVWVKLVKSGTTFTGYRSADGVNWTQVGTATVEMGRTSSLSLGLAVTSHNDGIVCIANFDNVAITGGTGSGGGGGSTVPTAPSGLTATAVSPTQINLTWQDNSTNETGFILEGSSNGVSFQQIGTFGANNRTAIEVVNPGTHRWYRVAATNSAGVSPYSNIADATTPPSGGGGGALPPPWQDEELGSSNGGSASYSNGVFYVTGDGGDIYGGSDSFHFVWQPATNDVTIISALDRLDPVTGSLDPWARFGLMIRESYASSSAQNVMVFLSSQHGTGMTFRGGNGDTQYIPGPATARFAKLTRTGNTFSAYVSPDGNSWQLIGSATVNMPETVYVGLAVTSHSAGNLVRGQFSQVSVSSSGGSGGGGSGGGLYPWANEDVGRVGLAGSATRNGQSFTVSGSGADIWGSTDAFQYVYQVISGNGELVARLTSMQNTEPWAKAGLMARASSLSDSPNVLVMETVDHGTGLQWRTTHGGQSSYVPGPFWTPPVWLRLQRQGTTITGSTSLDGVNWTVLGSQSLPIEDPILIGLAVTSHNNSELNTATFDNVTFTPLP